MRQARATLLLRTGKQSRFRKQCSLTDPVGVGSRMQLPVLISRATRAPADRPAHAAFQGQARLDKARQGCTRPGKARPVLTKVLAALRSKATLRYSWHCAQAGRPHVPLSSWPVRVHAGSETGATTAKIRHTCRTGSGQSSLTPPSLTAPAHRTRQPANRPHRGLSQSQFRSCGGRSPQSLQQHLRRQHLMRQHLMRQHLLRQQRAARTDGCRGRASGRTCSCCRQRLCETFYLKSTSQ